MDDNIELDYDIDLAQDLTSTDPNQGECTTTTTTATTATTAPVEAIPEITNDVPSSNTKVKNIPDKVESVDTDKDTEGAVVKPAPEAPSKLKVKVSNKIVSCMTNIVEVFVYFLLVLPGKCIAMV